MLSVNALMPGRSSLLARPTRVKSACKYSVFTLSPGEQELIAYSANVSVEGSPDKADPAQVAKIPKGENLPPAPIDGSVDKWFFISGAAV